MRADEVKHAENARGYDALADAYGGAKIPPQIRLKKLMSE